MPIVVRTTVRRRVQAGGAGMDAKLSGKAAWHGGEAPAGMRFFLEDSA